MEANKIKIKEEIELQELIMKFEEIRWKYIIEMKGKCIQYQMEMKKMENEKEKEKEKEFKI